jgi:hypothetical protein
LASNSPVFERILLTSDCKEVQIVVIEITDFKAIVIEGLIEFMHRGEIDNLDQIAVELFKASDKYLVEPLKASFLDAKLILYI